jgi:hypothetical protein
MDERLLNALCLADPEPLSSETLCISGFPEVVDVIPLIFLDKLIESSSSWSRLSIRLPLKSTYSNPNRTHYRTTRQRCTIEKEGYLFEFKFYIVID